jgi:hypothetical protein
MNCPICNASYDEIPAVCSCGTPLKLEDAEKQVFRQHASNELKRNTKGLAGFGCLTIWFGSAGVMAIFLLVTFTISLIMSPRFEMVGPSLGLFLAFAFWGVMGIFAGKAAIKRWKRRKYYAKLAKNPPDIFPPRPPGLSDKQFGKEIERLKQLDNQMFVERKASGHIDIVPVEPLPEEIRAQHVWVPGLPGYGKSTLLHWMAMQDIEEGRGLTIIDPAGDLVGNGLPDDPDRHVPGIIDWIPYERIEDTIYLDLKQPVPIDFFSYADEDEKQTMVANLVDLFTRLGEMFGGQPGVRFGGIVRNTIYTLFEAAENKCPTSFIDIYDFIKDPVRRKQILDRVSEKTRAQWDRFPNEEKTEPIISRLTPLAKNPRLRTIFGTPNARLKFSEVMDEKTIVLVNIGGAGEAGIILGTMLLSQLLQAALKRSELPRHRRVPHHLYVDEFQNFQVGTDMARMLTQCRKYNLCLTIANQYTAQIPGSTLSAVFGGTSTWFLFRMSPQDIPVFTKSLPSIAYTGVYEKQDPNDYIPDYLDFLKDKDAKPETVLVDLKPLPFDPQILATLQVGEAIHRKADATAQKVKTYPMGRRPAASFADLIRERTITQYGCPPPQEARGGLESAVHEKPAEPFPTNEGKTRGPGHPR